MNINNSPKRLKLNTNNNDILNDFILSDFDFKNMENILNQRNIMKDNCFELYLILEI